MAFVVNRAVFSVPASEPTTLLDDPVEAPPHPQPAARGELPLAIVQGRPLTEMPKDLYIPPEALAVILESFEGPLDLLLYLIRRQNLDILDVDVAAITHQYMTYIEMMQVIQLELAAEYLLMAAMLAEIKSRMLLPRQQQAEDEDDPRAELLRRLQEYERFKRAADAIDTLPRIDRDTPLASAQEPAREHLRPYTEASLQELLLALAAVLRRLELNEHHHIEFEPLSTRARMAEILDQLAGGGFVPFGALLRLAEGRMGVVVTFLAIMELIKEALIDIVQGEPLGPIHVKARAA